jgi:tetratricopeptide (TPR) repeat protein
MSALTKMVGTAGVLALLVGTMTYPGAATAQQDAQEPAAQTNQANEANDQGSGSSGNGGKKGYDREVSPGTMSENMYRRLEKVHDLIGEEKYADAESKARDLVDRARSDYEEAVAVQTYGHILASREKYPAAIGQFKRAIELDALPNPTHFGMMFNVAQLLISTEKYEEGLQWLNRYFDEVPQSEIDRNAYVVAASANAELNNHRVAIDYIEKALELADEPKESWYQLLLAMHLELKDYQEAGRVLERMVRLWPDKKQYWTQLSSIYLQRNQDKQALSVLELAHTKGLLEKESEWKQLAQLYLFLEIPYKGAKVLQEGIQKGIVEQTKENFELLGNAWYSARETDKAIEAFEKAGNQAANGKIDMRRAHLLVDKEDWGAAREAINAALDKGGIDNPGNAYILLGMSNFELGNTDAARRAFQQAMDYDASRNAASQWLRHLENESERQTSSVVRADLFAATS